MRGTQLRTSRAATSGSARPNTTFGPWQAARAPVNRALRRQTMDRPSL